MSYGIQAIREHPQIIKGKMIYRVRDPEKAILHDESIEVIF